MKISELEKNISLYSLIEDEHQIKKVGSDTYRVDPCPICNKSDHFTLYPKTNSYSSFADCAGSKSGGSVYQYLQEVKGMNESEAYKELSSLAGHEATDNGLKVDVKKEPPQLDIVKATDKTTYVNQLYQKQSLDDKKYFASRGIHPSLIDKYKLSVYQDKDGQRAMLPIWHDDKVTHYTTRALEGQKAKYKNSIGGNAPFFNQHYILTEQEEVIFITEGIMDALTLESRGYKAISIDGAKNANRALELIKITDIKSNAYITAFDNDQVGESATENFTYPILEIPKEYKDVNEWGTKELSIADDEEGFISMLDNIAQQLGTLSKPDKITDYITNSFYNDIEEMKPYKQKKTGFTNLDKELKGVFPGLYVIGGVSSVGKTTFIHQLGDQMAEAGDHVLFFSLEQSKMEMVSKSIARTTAKNDLNSAVSSTSVRSGYKSNEINKAVSDYLPTADRVSVVEGNFDTNVTTIKEYVANYINMNKVKPIIIVDYLQIIPALTDRASDKERVDGNVTALKRLSRDYGLSIFVISSLNRGNYLTPIDFESFKESGGIEYTADVVIGLQLEAMNEDIFNKAQNIKEKRERVKEAKNEHPRQIELVCLKNRNGTPSFSCSYSYWSKYDLFEVNTEVKEEKFSLDFSKLKQVQRT